ncbi:Nramp family divalent metal transporter [Aquirufa sp. TARAVU-A1A]
MSNSWRKSHQENSMSEVFASIPIPKGGGFWKNLRAFIGPGFMVAVGYMDPGNWATDLAGGAQFGYTLLSVILVSSLFAILLQHLALKLGVATGRDLAQACGDSFSKPVVYFLWIICELAIAACDLAEVIGSALALHLLFGIPILAGILITILDVFLILYFQNRGFRVLESIVMALLAVITLCFGYEIWVAQPAVSHVLSGLLPQSSIVMDEHQLYVAIGILGATVMPHNLYLHSSIVQTRAFEQNDTDRRKAIKYATWDSTISLSFAFFINASILILAAAAFHWNGRQDVADIQDAFLLLDPVMGTKWASILFAVALLASGQNATVTGTLAGQIVMEGFIDLKMKPWLRRLITRLIAIVPAFFVTWIWGESHINELLILSQVVLSMQLSFAVIPLVWFTSDANRMGKFVNPTWMTWLAWVVSAIILSLNCYLLGQIFFA